MMLAVRERIKATACLTDVTGFLRFFFFPTIVVLQISFYFNTDRVFFVFVEYFSLVEDLANWFGKCA